MERLIAANKSIIPALDVTKFDDLARIVQDTRLIDGVSAYKVGFELALTHGLAKTVSGVRLFAANRHKVIYDHQKAGTDIDTKGTSFASVCRTAGVDAVILFPLSGAKVLEDWVKAAQDQGLHVIVGGHMTHPKFLESDGGFISDKAPQRIYEIAAENKVRSFVVPGNQPLFVERYRMLLEGYLGLGNFDFFSPGFIKQDGNIADYAKVAGDCWHAIIGGAITEAKDAKAAAELLTSQIR